MRILTYILALFLFINFGCQSDNQVKLEWDKVKNGQDFSEFFNFALENNNLKYFPECIDSLEKYKPTMYCHVLYCYDYYLDYKDSIRHSDFFIDDECGMFLDYKMRNIVAVNIDRNDSILTVYTNGEYTNFNKLIISLYDTTEVSYDLPETKTVKFDSVEYLAKSIAVFINCEMLPDTIERKTSWETLINTTKQVQAIYQIVRNNKSETIFGKKFNQLNETESKFIINLVPKFIKIRFVASIFRLPPPPPPPPDIQKVLEDTVELDL